MRDQGKFIDFYCGGRAYEAAHRGQRRGHAFMNYLHEFDPEAFDAIRGTKYDPWDNEDRFVDFLAELDMRWMDPPAVDNETARANTQEEPLNDQERPGNFENNPRPEN